MSGPFEENSESDTNPASGRPSRLQRLRQSLLGRRGRGEPDPAQDAAEQTKREADADDREADTQAGREARAAEHEAAKQAAEERARADAEAATRAERDAEIAEQTRRDAQAAERLAAEQLAAERALDAARAAERADKEAAERESARRAAADEAHRAAERASAAEQTPAAEAPSAADTPAPEPVTPIPERPDFPLPQETLFEPWAGGWRGGRIVLDNLGTTPNQRLVSAALVEGINAEGPIHVERLARLVATAFEVRKLSASRIADLTAMIPKSTVTTENGTVAWPARVDPLQWTAFRGSLDGEARPTEHIALRELANAMVTVVESMGSMAQPELFGITRRIFGGKRVTANIEARMTAALQEALDEGRLRRDGSTIVATDR